ncbi:phosphatase PAP2 family protein [Sphingomonas flavalba]|uniref:phosphatase PAP2 family protein n=1 Tax=Sphingomonas flavalba TaxID=2559804 RepID=UPI0039E11439
MTVGRTVVVGCLLIAAALLVGLWITLSGTPAFDSAIIRSIAPWRASAVPWLALTHVGDGWPRSLVGIGIAALFAWKGRRRAAAALVGTMVAIAAVNSGLKLLFARPRPDLLAHLDRVSDLSFPSGHSANNMAFWLLLALLIDRRLALPAMAVAGLIGVSRIVVGVHWPSDVLAGWLLGAGFALIGWASAEPESRRAWSPQRQTML